MAKKKSEREKFLERTLRALLRASAEVGTVTLDQIGDAIGTSPVSCDDVERLIDALEANGRAIAEQPMDLKADLARVIAAARDLQSRLGRKPRLGELTAETRLSAPAVMAALRFARTLG